MVGLLLAGALVGLAVFVDDFAWGLREVRPVVGFAVGSVVDGAEDVVDVGFVVGLVVDGAEDGVDVDFVVGLVVDDAKVGVDDGASDGATDAVRVGSNTLIVPVMNA